MTPLHAHTQYIYIVYAKYQKASVNALVQADFPVYALSKHKQNMQTGKNGQVHKAVILSKIIFLASNFFMQMLNVSTIGRQSIRWLQQKLWYKLIFPCMHYLSTNKTLIKKQSVKKKCLSSKHCHFVRKYFYGIKFLHADVRVSCSLKKGQGGIKKKGTWCTASHS